jgi:hypothetical protein
MNEDKLRAFDFILYDVDFRADVFVTYFSDGSIFMFPQISRGALINGLKSGLKNLSESKRKIIERWLQDREKARPWPWGEWK